MTTWKQAIQKACEKTGDNFDNLEVCIDEKLLNSEVDYTHGGEELFTVWSEDFVYFPIEYDSLLSVGFVRRNPSSHRTEPIGYDNDLFFNDYY